MISTLLLTTAFAQTWQTEQYPVLSADPGTITENGIGAPTVVWDPDQQRFVMFFETRLGAPTADCVAGLWGIGAASSEDGVDWDVWPFPVVEPTPGTPYACVAAHPTVLLDDGVYDLWFKAEQGVADSGPWGTGQYSGVVHATVDVALMDFTDEIAALQAQIAAVVAARNAAMNGLLVQLTSFEDALLAAQGEFACDPDAPVCAPCQSKLLLATRPTGGSPIDMVQEFCQPFSFAIPSQVSVPVGGVGGSLPTVQLAFGPDASSLTTCSYLKSGNRFTLSSCSDGSTAGTVVTAEYVRLRIVPGNSNNTITATVNLVAVNAQTFDGPLLDLLDALQVELATGDVPGTQAALEAWIPALQDFVDWLAGFPTDPEKAALLAQAQAVLDASIQLRDDLLAWELEIADLQDQIDLLLAYEQRVDAFPDPGVALQVNQTFGFPSVAKVGSGYVMLVQVFPDIWRAEGATPDALTLGGAAVLTRGTVSWAQRELFDPNLVCSGSPVVPYEAFVGGRTTVRQTVTQAGISDAVSFDTLSWLLNATPFFSWANADQFRHFDVVRASDGAYRMWYTERDPSTGLNQIGLASTDPGFDPLLSTPRVCP